MLSKQWGAPHFGQYLRHKWSKAEKYQDLLIEKRFDACSTLWSMIVELVGNIDLIRAGVRAFRLSTPDGQGGHQLGEEVDTAREVAKSLGRLTRFVAENHMLLGPTVLGAWCVHYGALQELRIALNASTARAADVTDALGSLLPPFQDAIAEAIRCELQGADLKFLPSAERERLVKEGVGKGERLLAEAKDGPGRGGKADAEKG